MIERVTVFRTMGETFDTFGKACNYRESLVEKFIRNLPGFQDIPAKSRIALVSAIIDNRAALRDLLDYSSTEPTDDD